MEPINITLQQPITIGEGDKQREITEVNIREPLVKDLLVMDSVTGDIAKQIAFMSALTGLETSVLKKLHLPDYMAINKEVQTFLNLASLTPTAEG